MEHAALAAEAAARAVGSRRGGQTPTAMRAVGWEPRADRQQWASSARRVIQPEMQQEGENVISTSRRLAAEEGSGGMDIRGKSMHRQCFHGIRWLKALRNPGKAC